MFVKNFIYLTNCIDSIVNAVPEADE